MARLIVIATEAERWLIDEEDADVLVTGVGPLNVLEALRNVPRSTPLMNVGFAGSVDIPVGTICPIGAVGLHMPDVPFSSPSYQLTGTVPCLSSSSFVTASRRRGCVFDMELAFILGMGFTDVEAVKVVSDSLNYEEYERKAADVNP